jgi:hypothetical protein
MAQQPLLGQGLLIIEASRLHSETPQSVVLLWMSDQPDAQTSTLQHTTLTRDNIHATGGIRTRSLSKRAAAFDRAATGIDCTDLYQ